MELEEVEKLFIDKVTSVCLVTPTISRNEYGILSVSIECPCEKIGYLTAYVKDVEITLSCKVSHTHFELSHYRRLGATDPQKMMIEEAATFLADFMNDQFYVSITATEDGQSVCSGWGPIGSAKETGEKLRSMLQPQYKSPILTEYWVWSGKYKAF